MSRIDIPTNLGVRILEDGTSPRALVYLGSEPPLYLASGNSNIEYDGDVWYASGIDVKEMSFDPVGTQTCKFSILNTDNVVSSLALNPPGLEGVVCQIYYYDVDAYLIFDGFLTDIGSLSSARNRLDVDFTAHSIDFDISITPRLVLAPPVLNHIPPDGTVINWDGQSFRLKREET